MSSASPVTTPPEPTTPYPPRFRWLKRLGLSLLLLVIALLLARAWAVHRAQSAYDAEIASLRARGEPVTLEDLRQPPIPDEQNAAWYLDRAADILTISAKEREAAGGSTTSRDNKESQEIIDGWIERNQESLTLLHKAREIRVANWNWLFSDPWNSADKSARKQRPLEQLVFLAAAVAARKGDVEGFVERCRDELTIERVVQNAPLPTSQMEALR